MLNLIRKYNDNSVEQQRKNLIIVVSKNKKLTLFKGISMFFFYVDFEYLYSGYFHFKQGVLKKIYNNL
jgi:hypothetical protein